jgi:hypothetical protein
MNLCYDIFLGDVQQIVVILHLFGALQEFLDIASVVFFDQLVGLELGSHSSIKHNNSLIKDFLHVRPECVDVKIILCKRFWIFVHLWYNYYN